MEIYNECFYGCGREGNFFLKTVKKWCCEKSHNKCLVNKEKNSRSHRGKKRDPELMKQIGLKQRGKVFTESHRRKLSKVWKGRKHTLETKRKMSKVAKGRIVSKETKQKMSDYWKGKMCGEDNPNWRGGISTLPYCFEFTDDLKEFIKERDDYTCQNPDCYGNSNKLCVHHIDYDKINCVIENLITLCGSCNSRANFNRSYWEEIYTFILERNYNGINSGV